MDSLEADQLAAFLAVVDTGSLTAAGRSIGRDPSVVSRRVAALEKRLGIRLLERSTRRVSVTEAGLRFRQLSRQGLDLLRMAETEAREMASAPSGLLRIALPPAFGRMWVAPALPRFLALHPSIQLEVELADRFVDLVADGFDLALRIGEMKDSRLLGKRIAPTKRLLCASPDYLAGRAPLREPGDLRQHDCLAFTPMFTHPVWHMQRGKQTKAVTTTGRFASDDVHTLVDAAVQGAGVMMAADWLVARELVNGRLVRVLPDWEARGEAGVYVVRASSRHAPAKTRAFLEWIEQVFVPVPWASSTLAKNARRRPAAFISG